MTHLFCSNQLFSASEFSAFGRNNKHFDCQKNSRKKSIFETNFPIFLGKIEPLLPLVSICKSVIGVRILAIDSSYIDFGHMSFNSKNGTLHMYEGRKKNTLTD